MKCGGNCILAKSMHVLDAKLCILRLLVAMAKRMCLVLVFSS